MTTTLLIVIVATALVLAAQLARVGSPDEPVRRRRDASVQS